MRVTSARLRPAAAQAEAIRSSTRARFAASSVLRSVMSRQSSQTYPASRPVVRSRRYEKWSADSSVQTGEASTVRDAERGELRVHRRR